MIDNKNMEVVERLSAEDRDKIARIIKEFSATWTSISSIESEISVLRGRSKSLLKTLRAIRDEEETLIKELEEKYPDLKGKIEIPLSFLKDI